MKSVCSEESEWFAHADTLDDVLLRQVILSDANVAAAENGEGCHIQEGIAVSLTL